MTSMILMTEVYNHISIWAFLSAGPRAKASVALVLYALLELFSIGLDSLGNLEYLM